MSERTESDQKTPNRNVAARSKSTVLLTVLGSLVSGVARAIAERLLNIL
ncbi:hypothetical protein [Micromonospora sp. NPDC051141]